MPSKAIEPSQKGDIEDVLRWERFREPKQLKAAAATLRFLLRNGKDTGDHLFIDERSDHWRETKVSRAAFRKFAENQSICSGRNVRLVMRKLVDLGFVKVHTQKRRFRRRGKSFTRTVRTGYGLDVKAAKRYRDARNKTEAFLLPLLIRKARQTNE